MTRALPVIAVAVLSLAVSPFAARTTAQPPAAQPVPDRLPDGSKVVKFEARTPAVKLSGPFAYSQLLLTAQLDNGETIDATRTAKIDVPAALVSLTPNGLLRPLADGSGEIIATLAGRTVKVPVTVAGAKADPPISFVKDVQPVLSKLGCNAGTCHGAQAGKNGFKLSLRGYDPLYDHRALTDDLEGRRFNRAAPEQSLMLLKTSGAVPHQGGVLTQPGDPNFELLRRWITQGVKLDLDAPRVKSIAVSPKDPTLGRIGSRQQFAVIATYTDGTARDVTAESFIDSSNTEVATVDKTGLLTTVRRGEATMLARYEGAYSASTVVSTGDRAGFAWEQRPVYNYIDELVDKKLQRVKILPSDVCDDATFVRRVFIDLTGVPPTAAEVRAFLDDKKDSKAKREELIDKLVGSEGFIDHWTNKWADLLQVNGKFLAPEGAAAFRKWIRDAVANNMPYDKFAYDILTAKGSNVENPPAAYYKTLRTADVVMENTTQLFLAVRFNCNKCHDHPFERWTQDNYYNLAAYFAQVGRTEDPKFKGQKIGGTNVEQPLPKVEVVADVPAGEIKHDRTGLVAPPKFPFEVSTLAAATDNRRVQAAKWITSPKNPYFAKSYVNRLWSYLTGVGIIEPIDDIRAGNPPTNPELLDRLTDEFVKGNFDARKVIKDVCKSRTYQLAISTNRWNKGDEINYSHAAARRLPAEVLYDAVHKATGSLSRLPGLPPGARAAQLLDSNVELPGGFLELFGKPARESACECERSGGMNLGPILAMVNGPIVGDAIKDPANRVNTLVLTEKDDAKVVDEIYLSVLNRYPTAKEREAGIAAIRGAGADFAAMQAEYKPKEAAFAAYTAGLDAKQKAWEAGQLAQKPTKWTTLELTKMTAKSGATLTKQKDGSVLVSGKSDPIELYTFTGESELKGITGLRLEAMADASLPAKGPGRAPNGNFVLQELKLSYAPTTGDDKKPRAVKLQKAQADFAQQQFPIANVIDGNPTTGWAIASEFGKDHVATFQLAAPVGTGEKIELTVTLDQHFGQDHNLGRVRLSVTTDPDPKLVGTLTAEQIKLLETPADKRTPAQRDQLRAMYLATDAEYARLAAEAAKKPPAEARVLGAQDLTWALINSPAFLFNH